MFFLGSAVVVLKGIYAMAPILAAAGFAPKPPRAPEVEVSAPKVGENLGDTFRQAGSLQIPLRGLNDLQFEEVLWNSIVVRKTERQWCVPAENAIAC